MLQDFRDNLKGVTAFILVGIIIIPFALFGVDSIFISGSAVEEAASVNGEPISKLRLQQAVAMRKQQILNRFQDISPELIDEEQLQTPVLQDLVRQKALQLEALDNGMAIDQQRIYQNLLETESFQTDGVFDAERYEFLLRQQGYTPNSYSNLLREEMLTQQLVSGITSSGFATDQEVALLAGVSEQTRDFYYLTIPAAPVLDAVELSEQQITDFYQANQLQFMTDEQVIVDYIELSRDMLLDEVDVDESVVREQYELQVANSQPSESRRVAHILIEEGDEQQATLAELQARLKAGDDFAVLASEFSADYGTSETGGDLGYSQAGDLPEAFETALAEMEVGQVSQPVEGEAGIHILKLLDIKQANVATFEEQRVGLEQSLKQQMATELLLERIDELRELSYNAESLAATANQLGLEIKQSAPFGRAGGSGVAQYPAVVKAAFSEDVMENGYISEVIELGEDRVVVVSLNQHLPAAAKPLDQVRALIESQLKESAATEQLLTAARQYQQRLEAGESIEQIAKAENLEWQVSLDTRRIGGNLNSQLRQHVFSMQLPVSAPIHGGLLLDSKDYVLISLTKVQQGDAASLSRDQRNGLAASSAMASSGRDFQAYQQMLVDEADVAIAGQ